MTPSDDTPPAGGDNLVLIGPMGAGKSSIARELARLTRRRWVDTDKLIVQQEGRQISEIFALQGEAAFRKMELEVVRSLQDSRALIIATGGGIVTRPENLPLLQNLGCVIYLMASVGVLFERVSRNRNRPLLQTADPRATLEALLAQREPLYLAAAHATVDSSAGTHAEVAKIVLARAREYFARVPTGRSAPP